MADIDYDRLQRSFERALKNSGGGSGGFGGGSSGGGGSGGGGGGGFSTEAANAFTKTLGEGTGVLKGFGGSLLDLSGKFVKGGVKVSDVSETLAKNFKQAGYEGSILAGAFGKTAGAVSGMVKYVEEGIDSFRNLSQSGAAFNNDVIELRVSAANTRMTLEDFGDVVKNGSKFLTGLGATGTQGAKAFTEFSKSFFDSGVGDNLRNLGYTTKDINELLLTQMATTKLSGNLSAAQMEKEIKAAANLGFEMDAVAKLTGKSRKEQEEDLRKKQEDGQMRAAIELAVVKGGEDVRKAFNTLSTASQIGGKDFQKMQEEIFAMGRPSQEMAEKFALAGGEAQNLMMSAAKAAKAGDDATAKRLTQEAAAAYAQQQMSKTNLSIASQGVQSASDGVAASRQLTDSLKAVAKENNLDLNNAKDRNEALNRVNKTIEDEQKARAGATATIINAEARGADITAALNNQLVKPLNEKVNPELLKFSEYLQNLNKGSPGGFRGKTEDAIKTGVDGALKSIERGTKTTGGVAPSTPGVTGSREKIEQVGKTAIPGSVKELEPIYTALGSRHAEALVKRLDEIAAQRGTSRDELLTASGKSTGSAKDLTDELNKDPAVKKILDSATRANELMRRNADSAEARKNSNIPGAQSTAIGTAAAGGGNLLETIGGMSTKVIDSFKVEGDLNINGLKVNAKATGGFVGSPEISLIGEAGPEWVLNKEQMAATLEGAANRGMEQVSKLLPDRGNPTGGMNGFDLSSISKEISTTISSVSGGGSSTGQRVQSNDSKDAEKEIDDLRTKFFEDWAKRKEVIIEEMSIEDRKFSKVQAAMKADETAMKIKEDYEKKKAELQKKVDDGIKWEISTKEAAVEETKKIVEAELSSISSMKDAVENRDYGTVDDSEMGGFAFNQNYGTVDDSEMGGFASNQNFGSVDDSEMGGFSTPSAAIDLNSFNLPGFGNQLRSGSSSIPASVKKEEAEKTQKEEAEKAKIAEKAKSTDTAKPAAASSKSATLDDVVKSLDMLNKQMGLLISQQDNLMRKQERNIKSASSANVQDKV
jgi:hypothetical protein